MGEYEEDRLLPDERLLMADAIQTATLRERARCTEMTKETLMEIQGQSVSCWAMESAAEDGYDKMRLRARAVTYDHVAEMLNADIYRMGRAD